jgi:dihydrofolate reductase
MKDKIINIIVCCDINNGIGVNNTIPWHIKEEMKIFKEKTIGNKNNCIIMGRNTFESIPIKYLPLINRTNWVLSNKSKNELVNQNIKYKEVDIFNSHFQLIHNIVNTNFDTYWIIGGETLYKLFITHYYELLNEIHISILHTQYDCDVFFPEISKSKFTQIYTKKYDNFTHYIYKNNQKYKN